MTATLLIPNSQVETDRAGWLEARRQGVTASEIAAVMDLAPPDHGSAYSVWQEKVYGPGDDTPTPAMLRGRHLEPHIADMLRDQWPDVRLEPGGLYRNDTRRYQLATLDALIDGEPAEYKTVANDSSDDPRWQWGHAGTAVMPLHYRMQGLWQLDCMDASAVLVAALKMLPWRLDLYWLTRSTPGALRDIELMRQAAEEFMGLVEAREPPELTWSPATARALRQLHPELEERAVRVPVALGRRYASAQAAADRAKQRVGLASNELLARMGSANEAVALGADGKLHRVVKRVKFTRGPYKVTKEAQVDYLRDANWRGDQG